MAGIQREDVFQAADALVLAGSRPTIERVRQKIGRGSPNTVSPMLDEWFRELGPRLKNAGVAGAQSGERRLPDLPPAVLQAGKHMWDAARAAASDALSEARDVLESERLAVSAEREALELGRKEAEAALSALRSQVAELTEQLQATRQESSAREASMLGLLEDLRSARAEVQSAQAQASQAHLAAQDERTRQDERHLANERRLNLEVDRAREAAKAALAAQLASEKEGAATVSALMAECDDLALKLRQVQQESADALAARDRALREAQAQHQSAMAAALAQLGAKDLEFTAALRQLRESAGLGTTSSSAGPRRKRNHAVPVKR